MSEGNPHPESERIGSALREWRRRGQPVTLLRVAKDIYDRLAEELCAPGYAVSVKIDRIFGTRIECVPELPEGRVEMYAQYPNILPSIEQDTQS